MSVVFFSLSLLRNVNHYWHFNHLDLHGAIFDILFWDLRKFDTIDKMSIVPRLFNSSRFVRAINLSGFKSSVNVNYSTFPSNFGYVSIARPTHRLPATKFAVCAQRFYSDKTGQDSQTPKSPQYDETGAEIIYTGKFKSRIIRVKLFSLSTSMMGLAAQPTLVEKGMEMGGTGLAVFLCSMAGIFTFVTPVLLHFVTKKYVIKITHDPKTDEYVATTVSFFLMKNEVSASSRTFSPTRPFLHSSVSRFTCR